MTTGAGAAAARDTFAGSRDAGSRDAGAGHRDAGARSADGPGEGGVGPGDPASADRVFAALANATRREVLRLLRDEGPQPVQELAAHFAMRRPSLSEHLRVLRDAGLVREQRAGRQRIYRLQAAPLAEVQDWLHPYERFWREQLKGLGGLLDRMPDDEPS